MNKLELIVALKKETGIKKNEATAVVNLFFDEMSNALANYHDSVIRVRSYRQIKKKEVKKCRTWNGKLKAINSLLR